MGVLFTHMVLAPPPPPPPHPPPPPPHPHPHPPHPPPPPTPPTHPHPPPLHYIKSRSRNKHRNLWVGWCVSFWRPWFWSVYSIYYSYTVYHSCTLSNSHIWQWLSFRDWWWKAAVTLGWLGAIFSGSSSRALSPTEYRQCHPEPRIPERPMRT